MEEKTGFERLTASKENGKMEDTTLDMSEDLALEEKGTDE